MEHDLNTELFFQGDRLAIENIYHAAYPGCEKFVFINRGNREDAEDCFQEAIIATYLKGEVICLNFGVEIKAYLFGAIKKIWYKALRDRKMHIEFVPQYNKYIVLNEYEKTIQNEFISRLLSHLDPKCQEILVRHYVDGEKLKDIAEDLGLSEYAVKMRIMRCKIKLITICLIYALEITKSKKRKKFFATVLRYSDNYPIFPEQTMNTIYSLLLADFLKYYSNTGVFIESVSLYDEKDEFRYGEYQPREEEDNEDYSEYFGSLWS